MDAQQCQDGQYPKPNCTITPAPSSTAQPTTTTDSSNSTQPITTGVITSDAYTDTITTSERTDSPWPTFKMNDSCCDNCHASCKTCTGGGDNDCLSCPRNTMPKLYQNVTYCIECSGLLFGKFCVEQYMLYIVPVAFVFLVILIIVCMYYVCCRGRKGGCCEAAEPEAPVRLFIHFVFPEIIIALKYVTHHIKTCVVLCKLFMLLYYLKG